MVRGFDPDHGGFTATKYIMTVYGGCGFDRELIAVCLTADGMVLNRLEA